MFVNKKTMVMARLNEDWIDLALSDLLKNKKKFKKL